MTQNLPFSMRVISYLKGLWFYRAQRHGSDEVSLQHIHVSWFSFAESVLLSVKINCIYWIDSHNVFFFLICHSKQNFKTSNSCLTSAGCTQQEIQQQNGIRGRKWAWKQTVVVQSLSHIQLFATSWAAAHQAVLHYFLAFAQIHVR